MVTIVYSTKKEQIHFWQLNYYTHTKTNKYNQIKGKVYGLRLISQVKYRF